MAMFDDNIVEIAFVVAISPNQRLGGDLIGLLPQIWFDFYILRPGDTNKRSQISKNDWTTKAKRAAGIAPAKISW